MEKEKLINELRKKAAEEVRGGMKVKQFTFLLALLSLVIMALTIASGFYKLVPLWSVGCGILLYMILLILAGIFLPFGKISEAKIAKAFQAKVVERKKNNAEKLLNISHFYEEIENEFAALHEESEILKNM